jgi:hypothetical protein
MNYLNKINRITGVVSKKNYYKVILIFIVTLIFFKQIGFFKKLYFVATRDHEARLVSNYDHCGRESIGFLSHIKKKFDLTYKIPIINYESSPNSSWYYADLKTIETNKVIFLNYTANNKNFNYEFNNKFSHNLDNYKILEKNHNCYLLELR